jgi:hypothetical protein
MGACARERQTNVALIALFNYYYTFLQLEPKEMADQLKRSGASIPAVRPGRATADYITTTLNRMSILGSGFLAALAAAPPLVEAVTKLQARACHGAPARRPVGTGVGPIVARAGPGVPRLCGHEHPDPGGRRHRHRAALQGGAGDAKVQGHRPAVRRRAVTAPQLPRDLHGHAAGRPDHHQPACQSTRVTYRQLMIRRMGSRAAPRRSATQAAAARDRAAQQGPKKRPVFRCGRLGWIYFAILTRSS